MDHLGDNCSDLSHLESGSLVYNMSVFSVPAVLLNLSFFILFNFILCWTKQFQTEHEIPKIELPALLAVRGLLLIWRKDFSKREEAGRVFTNRASATSFHWNGGWERTLWNMGSRNPAVCEVTTELSFPHWNSGISTNFLMPWLSFLKLSHSGIIRDLQVGKLFDPTK